MKDSKLDNKRDNKKDLKEETKTSALQKSGKETEERLVNLDDQIIVMYEDFEDMKRIREEARKQMQARFLDIHKKIQYMKEALDSEGRRVNDSIKAFSSKFMFLINQLKSNFSQSLETEQTNNEKRFSAFTQRMNNLQEAIKTEKSERIKQLDEQIYPIRTHLDNLLAGFDKEHSDRLLSEKNIYRAISDEVFNTNEKMDREISERNTKLSIQREENIVNFKKRNGVYNKFQIQMEFDLKVLKDEIFMEMDTRFAHQNEIVDNISNFLKAFQDTLTVIGG